MYILELCGIIHYIHANTYRLHTHRYPYSQVYIRYLLKNNLVIGIDLNAIESVSVEWYYPLTIRKNTKCGLCIYFIYRFKNYIMKLYN